MKNIIKKISLLSFIFILLFSITGCGNEKSEKNTNNNEKDTTNTEQEEKEQEGFNISGDWKSAYKNLIKERSFPTDSYIDTDGYYLTDIDKNTVPELLIYLDATHGSGRILVYTYDNNDCLLLGYLPGGTNYRYYETNEKHLTTTYGHQDVMSIDSYEIKGKEIVQTEFGTYLDSYNTNNRENFDGDENDFQAKLNELKSSENFKEFSYVPLDDESLLNNY